MTRTGTLSVLLILLAMKFVHSQDDMTNSVRANNLNFRLQQMGGGIGATSVIANLPTSTHSEIVGDPYWDNHWAKSSVKLYKGDDLMEGYLIRYDIYKDELEFKIQNDVKVLPGARVKDIIWIDSLTGQNRFLLNAKEYKENNVPLVGFLELLVEGNMSLMKKLHLEILKPDFNPALNVGSKDTRILKKKTYYFSVQNQLTRIKSQKGLEAAFSSKATEMKAFMKKEGIRHSEEADLIKAFSYYNSL